MATLANNSTRQWRGSRRPPSRTRCGRRCVSGASLQRCRRLRRPAPPRPRGRARALPSTARNRTSGVKRPSEESRRVVCTNRLISSRRERAIVAIHSSEFFDQKIIFSESRLANVLFEMFVAFLSFRFLAVRGGGEEIPDQIVKPVRKNTKRK